MSCSGGFGTKASTATARASVVLLFLDAISDVYVCVGDVEEMEGEDAKRQREER